MRPARIFPLIFLAAEFLRPRAVEAAVDFRTEILPLLEDHCLKCHRAPHEENGRTVKPKGDLRLDAAWALLKGHDEIVPVRPGDPAHSDVVRVLTLPREDDDAMPPKGKAEPLNTAEVAKIKTWIAEGASFGGWEGNLAGRPAEQRTAAKPREHESRYQELAAGLGAAKPELLEQARAAGAQVAQVGLESPLLRVDFLRSIRACDDRAVSALAPIADHIAQLDLARTAIGDEACAVLARMPRLTRLDLRETKVTDAGVAALAGLEHLDSLNLYGAAITDEAVSSLAKLRSLRHLCLTGTKVTAAGRQALQAALPQAEIAFALDLASAPTPTKNNPAK